MTIYNLLAAHPAKVVVHVDGLAASIASVIAMAGDTINIADNAMMMIDDAWGSESARRTRSGRPPRCSISITATIAKTYAKRSGADAPKIRAMMAAETWMTAAEAKQTGLVDCVVDNMNAQACAFNPRWFKNAPAHLVAKTAERPARERFAAQFQRLQIGLASRPLRRPPRGALKPGRFIDAGRCSSAPPPSRGAWLARRRWRPRNSPRCPCRRKRRQPPTQKAPTPAGLKPAPTIRSKLTCTSPRTLA